MKKRSFSASGNRHTGDDNFDFGQFVFADARYYG